MTSSPVSLRPLLVGAVIVALLSQGGCAWTRSKLGMDTKYQESRQHKALAIPEGLDAPSTTAAVLVPDATGTTLLDDEAPPAAALASTTDPEAIALVAGVTGIDGFTVADTVENTWRRLGEALPQIPGASIRSSARVINSYEVTFQGAAMLLRAQADAAGGTRVVALGPDGQPITTGPASQLLALLRDRIG